jgi:hypothetical protein
MTNAAQAALQRRFDIESRFSFIIMRLVICEVHALWSNVQSSGTAAERDIEMKV